MLCDECCEWNVTNILIEVLDIDTSTSNNVITTSKVASSMYF